MQQMDTQVEMAELNQFGWRWKIDQETGGWRSGNHHEGDRGWEFFIERGTGDRDHLVGMICQRVAPGGQEQVTHTRYYQTLLAAAEGAKFLCGTLLVLDDAERDKWFPWAPHWPMALGA